MKPQRVQISNVRSMVFGAVVFGLPSIGLAAPVDLNAWTAESYSAVSGFSPGNWLVGGGGSFVTQTVNGQPTIYYSDFSATNSDVTGKVKVNTSSDDDFFGFVLGFNPGDTTNGSADYVLVDWKQGTQPFNFGGNAATNATPGTTASAGLAISRVTGTPSADELWGHVNSGLNPGGGVSEFQRGDTLGATGWGNFVEYEFRFVYTPTNLKVFVDGVEQADINGAFPDGRLGFYNFSQGTVMYSAFTVDSVPEPATLVLLGLGLAGLGFAKRRRA